MNTKQNIRLPQRSIDQDPSHEFEFEIEYKLVFVEMKSLGVTELLMMIWNYTENIKKQFFTIHTQQPSSYSSAEISKSKPCTSSKIIGEYVCYYKIKKGHVKWIQEQIRKIIIRMESCSHPQQNLCCVGRCPKIIPYLIKWWTHLTNPSEQFWYDTKTQNQKQNKRRTINLDSEVYQLASLDIEYLRSSVG